ncbi:MAG: hypothetical protein CSA20_06630 [Deltaproteobacteria bacterium]|nr:MAG: hypothetical protein CSA20_06630 [Deltaproteobacteria bacterium]
MWHDVCIRKSALSLLSFLLEKPESRSWDSGFSLSTWRCILLNEIVANVQLEKELCPEAPLYLPGPLVIDAAPGYAHVTSAIGRALAASYPARGGLVITSPSIEGQRSKTARKNWSQTSGQREPVERRIEPV